MGTHTYALMPVSPGTYDEIKRKLIDAGYGHAIHERSSLPLPRQEPECLDMHGIALVAENPGPNPATLLREYVEARGFELSPRGVEEIERMVAFCDELQTKGNTDGTA